MKKTILLSTFALAVLTGAAQDGTATINLPENSGLKQIVIGHASIDQLVNVRRKIDLKVEFDTINVNSDKIVVNLTADVPSRYSIDMGKDAVADFYMAPGENINVDVESIIPLNYTVSGTRLMEDMSALAAQTNPIEQQYYALIESGQQVTEADVKPIMDAYDKAIKGFVSFNPESPAVPFAILDLEGEDFIEAYNNLTPEARRSIMMPFAEKNLGKVKDQIEAEKVRAEMVNGSMEAPDFTLPDLNGKMVSLSQFRGKWVILDFWGSWCGWCIKGLPKLKQAYKEYAGKIEVIGIDCRESQEAWRAGVKKYELPWVNVYNGEATALLQTYGVQGFPTKAIVNPEGKLVDVTVGEDPTFYDKLSRFINK
ncbi:MAG: redoxin domain-containing protein [Muribaculaceae bacterium]|nr:redoxin domain-containing protein [Muribaculaceae bacterium]